MSRNAYDGRVNHGTVPELLAVRATERAGRHARRRAWAAVAVLLLGMAGLVGIRAVAPGRALSASGTGPASPAARDDAAAVATDRLRRPDQQLVALNRLLAARSRAVLSGDRSAWLRTVDPQARGFRARQAAVFDHLSAVPLAAWTYDVLGRGPTPARSRAARLGGPSWVARVLVGYRIRGFDGIDSTTQQSLTMVLRDDRWFVAGDGDGRTDPQPWDLGLVHVAKGTHVVALGTAGHDELRLAAEQADRAVDRVSAVWGPGWARRAVLIVPRTQREFGRLLLRPANGLDQVAAVTTGDLSGQTDDHRGTRTRSGNDRIVLNPAAFARLGPLGRRVVLTHEMTHVAVRRSTAGPVPIWLSEGFADYVGYLGTGVPQRAGAADLLTRVRAGKGPRRLPATTDFDPTRSDIAPAYSAAWLACSLVAQTSGQTRLVALYRQAAADGTEPGRSPEAALAQAFRSELGVSQGAFTTRWRGYLADLAAP
jgi:hypothetical protein